MNNKENPEDEARLEPTPDEPQVFAMKRRDDLWRMDKRAFLKSMVLGTAVGAFGCSTADKDNQDNQSEEGDDSIAALEEDVQDDQGQEGEEPIPPFDVGGISYQLIDLRDYNGTLPSSGRNLAVVAYVQSDFYFRYFDAEGNQAVNVHESNVPDQVSVGEIKSLAQTVAAKRSASANEQARISELFTNVRNSTTGAGDTASGRRMQGTRTQTGSGGRRMQGTIPGGPTSGRRLQGAEGRAEAGTPPRNLGTLRINGERYEESRVIATYSDGQTRISHAGGETVVRTEALPEIVQMQLPQPTQNPSPRAAAMPTQTTTTRPVSPPVSPPKRPSRPSSPPRRRSTGHYWRPN